MTGVSGARQSPSNKSDREPRSIGIQVYRVTISKDQFRTLPPEERALVLILGHALNQIGVFVKLVRFSSNKNSSEPTEQLVSAAQTQIIIRILYGVLVEAWEAIRTNYKIIGLKYYPLMEDAGQDAWVELKKHFGRSKLLHNRNRKHPASPRSPLIRARARPIGLRKPVPRIGDGKGAIGLRRHLDPERRSVVRGRRRRVRPGAGAAIGATGIAADGSSSRLAMNMPGTVYSCPLSWEKWICQRSSRPGEVWMIFIGSGIRPCACRCS